MISKILEKYILSFLGRMTPIYLLTGFMELKLVWTTDYTEPITNEGKPVVRLRKTCVYTF